MTKDKQIEEKLKITKIYNPIDITDDEMRKLADEMGKAISNEYQKRVLADERKLEAVLKENGWCKASEVVREIFEEIEKLLKQTCEKGYVGSISDLFAELKKKYGG